MVRLVSLLVLAAVLPACAVGPGFEDISPQDIPALERATVGEDADAVSLTRLGVAYGMADRPDDSRRALVRAVALPEAPVAAWAYLGGAYEELDEPESAIEAYSRYLDEGGGRAQTSVEARIEVLRLEILRRQARAALAMEDDLAAVRPDRATIGVLPLVVDGPAEYQALGVGLADLLTTDLSITDRIRVLERSQVAVLLDETRLALGGFTDHAAAARAGRLLRAGRLVQGQVAIDAGSLDARLVALVVDAAQAESEGQAAASGALERIMEMETQLALALYEELGIELTAAERARIEDKPTRNMHAFLAYSEGLQLLDQGDYSAASERFRSAAQLDPGFGAATRAADRAAAADQSGVETVYDDATVDLFDPVAELAGGDIEDMIDQTIPAGAGATDTGGEGSTGSADATTPQTTEVTAGSRRVSVPIILVRPRP